MITCDALRRPGINHGFFTRQGGYSSGIFASLNCGLGSGDDKANVKRNRAVVADALGVSKDRLVTAHQIHSADATIVEKAWPDDERPRVDGLVTRARGLAVAVLTADCAPVLFADAGAGIIGAAHAGWKGALSGVAERTVVVMEQLGARRANVTAVIGPTISPKAYEVGPGFAEKFSEADAGNAVYFKPSIREGHSMFDLPGYLAARLNRLGIGHVVNLGVCTYGDEDRYFSYRRTTHRKETDYGRQISAIALQED